MLVVSRNSRGMIGQIGLPFVGQILQLSTKVQRLGETVEINKETYLNEKSLVYTWRSLAHR